MVVQATQRLGREVGPSLHEEFHPASKPEDQVEGGLYLDVIVGEGTSILELDSCEDQSLLVRGNTFLVKNDSLEILYGEVGGDIASDGLPCQGLDINLVGARPHNHGHLPKFDLMRYRVDKLLRHEKGGCAVQYLVLDADLFPLAQLASLHEVIGCQLVKTLAVILGEEHCDLCVFSAIGVVYLHLDVIHGVLGRVHQRQERE